LHKWPNVVSFRSIEAGAFEPSSIEHAANCTLASNIQSYNHPYESLPIVDSLEGSSLWRCISNLARSDEAISTRLNKQSQSGLALAQRYFNLRLPISNSKKIRTVKNHIQFCASHSKHTTIKWLQSTSRYRSPMGRKKKGLRMESRKISREC
jgi:hypothetical protein